MQKCDGLAYNPIIFETRDDKNLKKILSSNKEEFIDYIHRLGLSLQHSDTTINARYTSTTILTLKTRCFKVEFNDNFVRISPLL